MEKRQNRIRIPDGVQDTLPGECYNKRIAEDKLRQVFFLAGYDEVETPGFEYLEIFADDSGANTRRDGIKFIDKEGDVLLLRPELTTPIARMAASKLDCFPARLSYISNAYGNENAYYSSQREFAQAGIELLGEAGPGGDAEVIAVAIEALRQAGLKNFRIEIGQVEFFKGLMEESGLTPQESEELRLLVDQKNDLAIELFLRQRAQGDHCLAENVEEMIRQLPTLYGGKEIFDQAAAFSSSARCQAAVDNLREIYDLLRDMGMESYISVDFGMLQSIHYYSGLIFKGYCTGLGFSLLSGGRYDALLGRFGKDMPATGFAMGIRRLLLGLEQQGKLEALPGIDVLLSGTTDKRSEVFGRIQVLRAQGKRAVAALELDEGELRDRARAWDAQAEFIG